MSITDLTKTTEERWLEARKNHKIVLLKCKICDGHLLPHVNGGWFHLDDLSGPVGHDPIAIWKKYGESRPTRLFSIK